MLITSKSAKSRWSGFAANPARVIVGSFAMLVILGTILLMLPLSSKSGHWMGFIPALFTATSAVCVTGLVVVDTFSYFSMFGQVIILILIQLGGLGLVTFATFFNMAIRKKVGLKTLYAAQESTSSDNITNMKQLLKLVFTVTFAIELTGALVFCIVFVPEFGLSGIFISVFLSISSYCNAGFDIFGFQGHFSSLTHYADNPTVLITVMLLIICGGVGFIVWQDLVHFFSRRRLTIHSKIVLLGTLILVVFGGLFFTFTEWNNPLTFGNMTPFQKVLNGFFHSVSTRTAGFNTVEMTALHGSSKFLTIIYMFIGAAPGGTAGGIKLTTMLVLFMTVVSVFRGYPETVIGKHKIEKSSVYKALTVVFVGIVVVLAAASTIFFTTHTVGRYSEINAVFEAASAFGTVGLSSGVSLNANVASRIILILTMFIGRVGPASLALSLALRSSDKNMVMPEAKIMVG